MDGSLNVVGVRAINNLNALGFPPREKKGARLEVTRIPRSPPTPTYAKLRRTSLRGAPSHLNIYKQSLAQQKCARVPSQGKEGRATGNNPNPSLTPDPKRGAIVRAGSLPGKRRACGWTRRREVTRSRGHYRAFVFIASSKRKPGQKEKTAIIAITITKPFRSKN